ncbi:MAG: hemerythrin domain-containing protein [Mangrovibacterium sp.]
MLYEHEEGRRCLAQMREALAEDQVEKLCFSTRAYVELLANHIYKEDQVLYPMAEEAISDEEKQVINQQYEQAEHNVKATYDVERIAVLGMD